MRVMIDCGVCPDLHTYDQVEAIVLLRHVDNNINLVCIPFLYGRYLLAYERTGTKTFNIFNDYNYTRRDLQAIGESIKHLATHYPGKGLKPGEMKVDCHGNH